MKRILCFSLVVSIAFACLADGGIVQERKREAEVRIAGLTTRVYTERFQKNEPARAFASGDYRTSLGLYVFDPQGNCVAHDTGLSAASADDCFVEWIPPEQQSYSIEVVNTGLDMNVFQLALR